MPKVFQPIIKERADEFIDTLNKIGFFKDNEIDSIDYAKTYLCEVLTQKFIDNGDIDAEFDEMFTDVEGESILRNILAGSILNHLKQKGILDSYEDETTEETFFFTKLGKKMKDEGEFD